MKKVIIISSVMIALMLIFMVIKRSTVVGKNTRFTIGILQTASHPALDSARDGFIEELKKTMGSDVSFIIRNGEGSIVNIHTIAEQFHNNKNIDGIFAIATPAAQAIAAVEREKPIFIAAVTDPNELGLIHPATNVCGTDDMIDVIAQIDMLTKLLSDAKTVGLIYNNGEANSVAAIKKIRAELERRGLIPLNFAISSESDLPTAAQLAFIKSDVILAPTDNMVASSIVLLSSLAAKNKKPLIVSDNMLVPFGALASCGINYIKCGKQTARIAYKVFMQGNRPCQLPIEQVQLDKIYINKNALTTLELTMPESLRQEIVFVGQGIKRC